MKTKLRSAILPATLLLAVSTQVSAFTKTDELLNAIETENVSLVDSLVRYGVDPN